MSANSPGQAADESKAKLFISYSRKDAVFADRLELTLKRRGFEVLIDRSGISDLEDWRKRIGDLIAKADTIVFVLSPDSLASPECKKEVEYAVSLNKRFAPIVWRTIEDVAVPEALARINRIDFVEASFEDQFERLVKALRTDLNWIRKHTEYGEAAGRWDAAGRPGRSGLLLRSPILEDAEQWIASRPLGRPSPACDDEGFSLFGRVWRASRDDQIRTRGDPSCVRAKGCPTQRGLSYERQAPIALPAGAFGLTFPITLLGRSGGTRIAGMLFA